MPPANLSTEPVAGLPVYYPPGEEEAARLVAEGCRRTADLVRERWGLAVPRHTSVHVMTGWQRFYWDAVPGLWKVLLVLAWPLIARRAALTWPHAGGWAIRVGPHRAVGVKPAWLMETSDRTLGRQIFVSGLAVEDKVQSVTCHELVHACTSHLSLPHWLNEGLAVLAMEYYLDRRVVLEETRRFLDPEVWEPLKKAAASPRVEHPQAMVALYARGYWHTRRLAEDHPDVLRELLARPMKRRDVERRAAAALGANA